MKDFIENLLQKYGYNPESSLLILLILFFYITFCFIIDGLCNDVPFGDIFSKVLINPVVFFGVPNLFLKHARYKELLRIYKNYTTEEFLAVYQQPHNIAYKDGVEFNPGSVSSFFEGNIYYYDKETLDKLRPLARDLLCISDNIGHDWELKDWIKEGKSIEDFIKKEYKETYCSLNNSFLWLVFLGIYIQLSLWGIIGYDKE